MNRTALALAGSFLIVGAAVAAVLFMQERGTIEASSPLEQAQLASVVPEAGEVHEGPRTAIPLDTATPIEMKVYQLATCGCCGLWVDHIEQHGFEVETEYRTDMAEVKRSLGLPPELASCHTGVVNGYVIEGHVPGPDLRRFLAEAPEARGLTVPGMPLGSPGMEVETGHIDRYQVLTFRADGSTTVFAEHGPAPSATAAANGGR